MLYILLCVVLFAVICSLFYFHRTYRQKRKKKVVGKVMSGFLIVILFVACTYCAMLLDTHSLMREVKDALKGNIPAEITEGTLLSRYNILDRGFGAKTEDTVIGKTEVSLIRYFTIHNFRDGYIYAFFSHRVYDSFGRQFSGSYHVPLKWKIHKENGKWEIVEIFEAP